jgi:hypothetical protein
MVYRRCYYFNCDTYGDEYREGRSKNCGKAVTSLMGKRTQVKALVSRTPKEDHI